MAEVGDEREKPEQAPSDWSLGWFFSEFVNDPDDGDGNQSDEGRGDEGVRDAAVMLESGNRAAQSPEYVEVGGFGGERHGERCVGRLTVEAGASETGSGEEVGDGFHRLA